MPNSDSPRPCRTRRADFFESSLEEARIDRLQIDRLRVDWLRTGWPTFGERRSIKGRVGNCGRAFSWAHAFSIELNYCLNGIRIDAQRKMRLSICHLMPTRSPVGGRFFVRPHGLFVLMRGRYHYLLVLLSDVGTIACAA